MMRNFFTVAVAATIMMVAGNASAITVSILWDDTGTDTLTFASAADAQAAGSATATIRLDNSDIPNITSFGFGIALDTSNGGAISSANQYDTDGINGTSLFSSEGGGQVAPLGPFGFNASSVTSYSGGALSGSLGACPSGTNVWFFGECTADGLRLGSITVDLSSIGTGDSAISFTFTEGRDNWFDDASPGNDITDQVDFTGTGTVNVVPEPATASLLVLGLAGLAVASRRRS